ncbi:type II toxin-antitoxin system RelE/ParE family toxin [Candidatus Babeliales bacterium]|nr:type II toxin-antitoxin system RelE/ParE family toxin [Candidatus Babeliales bacterium]MCF7899512.1 type II toxin-antitoxin system RelE/ParE family toxin [Candidatus Babeliales bacterium]
MGYKIEIYQDTKGKKPFDQWFEKLKNFKAKTVILGRLDRIKIGNLGDSKLIGDGVSELRFHIGPGYRLYYAKIGTKIIVLLCGGAKSSQSKDIKLAKQYLLDFKLRRI